MNTVTPINLADRLANHAIILFAIALLAFGLASLTCIIFKGSYEFVFWTALLIFALLTALYFLFQKQLEKLRQSFNRPRPVPTPPTLCPRLHDNDD